MYKEWIYNGEIEKTALNATMRKMKDIMKSMNNQTTLQKEDSVKKIWDLVKVNLRDKVGRKTLIPADMPTIDPITGAGMMQAGIKGRKAKRWVPNQYREDIYRFLAGRTGRETQPVASKKLTEKLESNAWRQKQKQDKINLIKW